MQYNDAHTEPLFKTLQFLKVNDILKVQQLKFYFSLIHNKLPIYFNCFNFSRSYHFHNYFTRLSNHFHVVKVKHTFATKCPQIISIVPLCPHADTTERLVRPVVSAVPLCLQRISIVPLCPHANIMEKPLCPVMFMLGWSRFLQQYSIIYTYIWTIFNSLYVSWK